VPPLASSSRIAYPRIFGRESRERFTTRRPLPEVWGVQGVVPEPGSGLTYDSADAAEVVLLPACRPGPVPGTRQCCRSDLPGLGKRPGFQVRRPAGACHPSTRKGRAMTIVEDARVTRAGTNGITAGAGAPPAAPGITGGVDTHADTHVAAALDPIGGLLGTREFPATAAGYAALPGWAARFRDRRPGRRRGHRQLRGRPGPAPGRGRDPRGGGRPRGPAGPAPAGQVRPPSMRSARPAPPSPAGPRARRGAVTARSRRSGR
jgi:hypothetical protein